METVIDLRLFYPMLFVTIIIITFIVSNTIKQKNNNKKDTEIFIKSSDNAKDVTLKVTSDMHEMHDNVVQCLPKQYEDELHSLEKMVREIKEQINELTLRVIKIENKNSNEKIISMNKKKNE